MSGNLPVDTVLAFLEQINARNVDGLCALMTDDHVFLDGLGNRMQGRESMRKGWAEYFRMFPDYRVSHTDVFCREMWWRHLAPPKERSPSSGKFQRKTIGARRRPGALSCAMA